MKSLGSEDHAMQDAPNEVEDHSTQRPMILNRPTVGGLRLPTYAPGPVLRVVLYLDLLPSDGDVTKWRDDVPKYNVEAVFAHSGRIVNNLCARQDLQALCGGPFTIKELPVGYQSMRSDRGHDKKIFGHPSGSYYRSTGDFAAHIAFMMKEDLPNCTCVLCSMPTWRKTAPFDAVLRVGLPRVPGGAVAAALAQSPARLARQAAARTYVTAQPSRVQPQFPPIQPLPVQPELPIAHFVEPILAGDLSWTNYTTDELFSTLSFVRSLDANLEDIDAIVLVHITDNRADWAPEFLSYLSYLDGPNAQTSELDDLWKEWFIRQRTIVEATKATVKSAKAAQESLELLQRARDVKDLSQWQKEIISQALGFIDAHGQGQDAVVKVKDESAL